MNSFPVTFVQGFCSNCPHNCFQNTSKYKSLNINTSRSADVKRIVKSIKQGLIYKRELFIFMNWDFKISIKLKSMLPLVMARNIILWKIKLKLSEKRKNRSTEIMWPIRYQQSSPSSTRSIPRIIYHDWKNLEMNKFSFLLTKKIENFLHVQSCS